MKTLIATIAISLAAVAGPGTAFAHGGEKAQHGGVVASGGDLSFELVPEPGGAAIYVNDHGKAADAAKMGGKLTVLNGTRKSEGELKPAGSNKLVATGVKIEKGAKAVAAIAVDGGKTVTARFTIK